jgi:hypothetical protein
MNQNDLDDQHTTKNTHYGDRKITVETAIYSMRNLRKYYNLKRLTRRAAKQLIKGQHINITQAIQELSKLHEPKNDNESLIIQSEIYKCLHHVRTKDLSCDLETLTKGLTTIINHIFNEQNTIVATIKKVTSWNTGGFTEQAQGISENISKGRVAKIIALTYRTGIVLWQETGMTDALAATIQQYDPNIAIVHSPPNNLYPYGTAILWPRHRYGDPLWTSTIVPGCIVATAINTGDGPAVIISAYMPRSKLNDCADSIQRFIPHIQNYPIIIIGGDFNFKSGRVGYEEGFKLHNG